MKMTFTVQVYDVLSFIVANTFDSNDLAFNVQIVKNYLSRKSLESAGINQG